MITERRKSSGDLGNQLEPFLFLSNGGNMIKRILYTVLFILIINSPAIAEPIISTCAIDVYFSPNGGATEAIVKEINNSKKEILVQAYSFTSQKIAKALIQMVTRPAWKS